MSAESTTRSRAYRVRLRPTPAQEKILLRLFGAKRFIWNWALQRKEEAFRTDGARLGAFDLRCEFTRMRHVPDTAWLGELPRLPLDEVFRDFERAWINFFAGRAKRPRFKRFGSVDAVRFTFDPRKSLVDRETGRVHLSGVGKLRFRVTEPLLGRLLSITVRRDPAGRWFGSLLAVDVPMPEAMPAVRDVVGIDVGKVNTASFSDGRIFAATKPQAKQRARLRRMERQMKRQRAAAIRRAGLDPAAPLPKGVFVEPSGRMQRTRQRHGKLLARIADGRRDHLHQVSAAAVTAGEVIVLEDLTLKGIQRIFSSPGRSIASLGEIVRQIEYKARWHRRVVVKVDRFFPSSRKCSACGAIHETLEMRERHWSCVACGVHHDRDHNAAVNLEREGRRILAGETPTTRRSRGSHARGEARSAIGKAAPIEQPASTNRENLIMASRPNAGRRRGRNRHGVRPDESPKKAPDV